MIDVEKEVGILIGSLVGGMLTAGADPQTVRNALRGINHVAESDERWLAFVTSCTDAIKHGIR